MMWESWHWVTFATPITLIGQTAGFPFHHLRNGHLGLSTGSASVRRAPRHLEFSVPLPVYLQSNPTCPARCFSRTLALYMWRACQPDAEGFRRLINNGDFSIDLAVEVDVPICRVGSGGGPSLVDGRPSSSPVMEQQQQQKRHPGNAFLDLLEVSPGVIGPRSKRHGRSARKKATTLTSTPTPTTQVVRIAVEVDGPSHFTANTRQPLSPTIYRRRCLEDRGWVVVNVPYWRWNQCRTATGGGSSPSPGPAEQEEALLLELMREAGLGEVIEAVAAAQPPPARQQP
ncbi:hypothetical protein Vretifemale_9216 [Volvox reticuliferus]|uniref:RAP domain-containing protein n=1 Tax=Volvox reticuliferus TaxID=1737510 RepID=A0A8J4CI60_9CHLO|nr:hypothetical protein Vretifemale_9216 [Volvox reticuliferus]